MISEDKIIKQRRRSHQKYELGRLQKSELIYVDHYTSDELYEKQKTQGVSPVNYKINNRQQFALPKIQHSPNIKTNKYIGEYNNMLGIITSKHQIPHRNNSSNRNACYNHNHDKFIERQNFVINQFFRPRKLGSCR
ncbi:unnamed protein product [Paramecium primaurelia]|uniref:Uncharacterized protein n=1 Tax=Paramecium primaurelia TaxID=5886 RepID=A0A8S1Q517_PARPR|nr:unnamed protein product [Paramecium primaurelia]